MVASRKYILDVLSRDLREGQACPPERNRAMDRRTHELLAKCTQEARVVHGEKSTGGRLLDGFLERGDHRGTPPPRSLETLPLGRPTPVDRDRLSYTRT